MEQNAKNLDFFFSPLRFLYLSFHPFSKNHKPSINPLNELCYFQFKILFHRSKQRESIQSEMQSGRNAFKKLIDSYIISRRWYRSNNKNSLYSKISPQGNPSTNVTPELDKWVDTGNKVRFAELQRIIIDLRKRKRFNQALQVSEWMKNRGVYTITPVQHAVQLDLIGKVHGFVQAESYFNSLTEEDKTDKVHGALLHCYARQCQTERALALLNTMREKGLPLSSLAFNDIMCLYASTEETDKVPRVFEQMKGHGVQPDNLSYRICINSCGVRSDIEGVEKILNEMENDIHITMDWNTYTVVANFYVKAGLNDKANTSLQKAEKRLLDGKDPLGYNHLISLHARLGNRDDVFRLWRDEKIACKRCLNREYINIMEALVRLDDLEEAEKVLKEWENSTNCYDFRVPKVLIVGYIEKGVCGKAEALLNQLTETSKELTAGIWGRLAKGYIKMGDTENALKSLKTAIAIHNPSNELKVDKKVVTDIVWLVGEKGSCDDAERVINLLRSVIRLEREVYHTLLKSCITRGKDVNWLLDIMRSDDYEEDEETIKILSLHQNAT